MKKFNITKQFLEKEYINNKKTIRQIAKEINCSHSNISFHFEKYNVSRRSRGEAIDKWSSILTKNFLEREYVSNKNSAYEMAKIMGCAVATIYFYLKKYNISTRTYSEATVGKYTAQKHSSYIDGRCSKVYYCKEEGCNNSIKYNTALYGGGRCRKCTDKIHSKLMIENNPNWKGGISFEPYSLNWTKELKEQIRKRDNHICQLCDKTQRGNNRALDVHHIDYNKKNCSEENLISLCSSCHTKTNNNRDYWMNYFNKKVLQLAI